MTTARVRLGDYGIHICLGLLYWPIWLGTWHFYPSWRGCVVGILTGAVVSLGGSALAWRYDWGSWPWQKGEPWSR